MVSQFSCQFSNLNETQAATKGFKYFTTVNGSTAAGLGYVATGGTGAIVAGTVSGHLGENISKIKTVYIKEKQYINKVGQIEHYTKIKLKAKK